MADRSLDFAMRVSADTREGRAALKQLEQSMRQAGVAGQSSLDPFTASVSRATGGAKELSTALTPLNAALAGLATAISGQRLIELAEAYSQITARLKLATQYTGDFAEVQAGLEQVARSTGSSLVNAVEVYERMAPALASMGLFGAKAVGVVETVNKAVALTAPSAQAASSALMQFGQMMGGAAVQAQEWNSVSEQTPGLAAAIAEGFGTTIKGMKDLIATGKLAPQEIIQALDKVRGRVERDFASLPKTIGQAMTILQDSLMKVVGTADEGSGALQSMANAIIFVADGVAALAGAGETLRPFVAFITNAVDGVSRLFRIVATGLAGYTLAIKQALSGDLDGALETYRSIADEVQRILDEPLADQKSRQREDKGNADARLKVETDLAKAINRLNDLRAVAAGEANADILLDDKALAEKRIAEAKRALEEQIKGNERLRDDLRSAWQEAINGAQKAREAAAAYFNQAKEARQAGADKAADRRMRGMSDADRDAYARSRADEARSAASSAAARAVIKAYEGDLKAAEQLANDAAKQAERAEQFASQITDDDTAANLYEELGKIREQALNTQGRIQQQLAKQNEDQARAIQEQIAAAETRIVALKAELAKPVTIQLDITAAEKQIATLREQLNRLGGAAAASSAPDSAAASGGSNADATTTVTAETTQAEKDLSEVKGAVEAIPTEKTVKVNIVRSGNSFSDDVSTWNSSQNNLPGRAYGGPLPGRAPHDRADNVIYRGTPGEWVIQRPAVRYWGASFMRAINEMRMPKFAYGGQIGADQRAALADSSAAPRMSGNTFVLDGQQYPVYTTPDVEAQLAKAFRMAALRRGSRK